MQALPIVGLNIWPVITRGAMTPREEFIWSPKVIRRGDWKLIDEGSLYYPHSATYEKAESPSKAQLFNVAQDPCEKKDLINERPKIVASLRKRLLEIKKEIRPAGPVEEIPKGVLIYGETEAKTFKG